MLTIAGIEFFQGVGDASYVFLGNPNQRVQIEGCDRGTPKNCGYASDDDIFDFVPVEKLKYLAKAGFH